MPNQFGFYTKSEVLQMGLPYYIPATRRWTSTPYDFAVLLSKTRCKQLAIPVMSNGLEKPSAFRLKSSNSDVHKYYALYDRTDVFKAGELSMDILFPGEVMGTIDGLWGICRVCGCIESDACYTNNGPCYWVDENHTLCSGCEYLMRS